MQNQWSHFDFLTLDQISRHGSDRAISRLETPDRITKLFD